MRVLAVDVITLTGVDDLTVMTSVSSIPRIRCEVLRRSFCADETFESDQQAHRLSLRYVGSEGDMMTIREPW